jgi:hypothetical protein
MDWCWYNNVLVTLSVSDVYKCVVLCCVVLCCVVLCCATSDKYPNQNPLLSVKRVKYCVVVKMTNLNDNKIVFNSLS